MELMAKTKFMEIINQHDLEITGGGKIFWTSTIGSEIIVHFKVDDIFKINAENYRKFLRGHFLVRVLWYKKL